MKLFLLLLIILNPFSQVLYLRELFNQLNFRDFARVHTRASLYSFLILATFALVGEPLLRDVFQVQLGSLRVFGGLVNLYVAHRFITAGEGSTLLFRGNIADLAPNITLPYMVGAGVLWVSILMGRTYPFYIAWAMIAGVLAINFIFVLISYKLFSSSDSEMEPAIAKNFAMLMRVIALFVGAIGVEMIFGGAKELLA